MTHISDSEDAERGRLRSRGCHDALVPGMLFVCVANRARSAWAEVYARAVFDQVPGGAGVEVASAGTWTRGGEPMWPPAAEEALAQGLDPTGFRSRLLTPQFVVDADVVLAATRALRDEVIGVVPAARSKVYTMRELAWLVSAVPADWHSKPLAERVQLLPEHARRARGRVAAPPAASLDIEDPAGRSRDVVRQRAGETFATVGALTSALSAALVA